MAKLRFFSEKPKENEKKYNIICSIALKNTV